jgi:putative addiction module component (TIGR02574 family)
MMASSSLQSLGIDRLSIEERLALIQEIWDSIVAEGRPPLSEARSRELRRRVAEDDASPDDVIPWDQVKAQAVDRLRRP